MIHEESLTYIRTSILLLRYSIHYIWDRSHVTIIITFSLNKRSEDGSYTDEETMLISHQLGNRSGHESLGRSSHVQLTWEDHARLWEDLWPWWMAGIQRQFIQFLTRARMSLYTNKVVITRSITQTECDSLHSFSRSHVEWLKPIHTAGIA